MAEVKINELVELASPSANDLFAVVTDTGAGVLGTRKIKYENILYDGSIANAMLADPYETILILAVPNDEELSEVNDIISFPVPDTLDGKDIVKISVRLKETSTSGDVVARIYNVTDSAIVESITITAGNVKGSSVSIDNPTLAEDDEIRIDVTSMGTGAKGLVVTIKVDKS